MSTYEPLINEMEEEGDIEGLVQIIKTGKPGVHGAAAEALARLALRDTGAGAIAVEAILEARDRGYIAGIHGTVEELISFDDRYAGAIAIAAGPRMRAVVVENRESAVGAVELLRTRGLGRATFLPLDSMLARRPGGKALLVSRDPDAVGFALDLIEFDEKYGDALSYVFASTIVVKDLAAALRLMGGVRIVTLDGTLIEPSGAMKGGHGARAGWYAAGGRKGNEEKGNGEENEEEVNEGESDATFRT